MTTSRLKRKVVTFRLDAPGASSVALAGDFNGWDPNTHALRKRKDGVWWTTVRLSPGIYQYKFVVDRSEWWEDPANPSRAPNSYGSSNSVCEVTQ